MAVVMSSAVTCALDVTLSSGRTPDTVLKFAAQLGTALWQLLQNRDLQAIRSSVVALALLDLLFAV